MTINITQEEIEFMRWVFQDVASDYIGADPDIFDIYLGLSDKLDKAEQTELG